MKNPLVFATVTYNRDRKELSDEPYFNLNVYPQHDLYYEAQMINRQRASIFVHEIEVDCDLDTVLRMIDKDGTIALYSTHEACAKYVELIEAQWSS